MNCPLCKQALDTLGDRTGVICRSCRTINGTSKFSLRINDGVVHKFYCTIGNYRLINDLNENTLAVLEQIVHNPKIQSPTYKSIYEGSATKISPFDIEALTEYVKALLIFM